MELLRTLPDSGSRTRGARPVRPAVLALDGGNSKTELVLVARDGRVLTTSRVARSANLGLGQDGAFSVLDEAIRAACRKLGLDLERKPIASTGVYCLAGADLPLDDRRIGRELRRRGWTSRNLVRNDTFAVLRAGTERGWGVAVVCGAGLNCSGVAPDGRVVRFPSMGELSGDLAAGGGWLGMMALGAGIRGRDGRGSRTMLERLVPAHFALPSPAAVMEAVYVGRLEAKRLLELSPLVFQAAGSGDEVARAILDRLADEVVAMASATIRRLRLTARDVEVVLGGGVFQNDNEPFLARIRAGIQVTAPRASFRRLSLPPVVGAALIGLDEIGAPAAARARLRAALGSGRPTRTGARRRSAMSR